MGIMEWFDRTEVEDIVRGGRARLQGAVASGFARLFFLNSWAFGIDWHPRNSVAVSICEQRADRSPGKIASMDTNTLIIIVLVVLLLGGGGFFYRGRR